MSSVGLKLTKFNFKIKKYLWFFFNYFQGTSNVENLSPHVIRQVTKELNDLILKPLEGINITINEEDVTNIQAIIEGPGNLIDIYTYVPFFDLLIF